LRSVCIRVGGSVTITLTTTVGDRWTPPTSSSPALATVDDFHTDADGALHATVTARRPGTATLSAFESFIPDPGGPPSYMWSLTLNIEP
jgi:hypothetical protein